MVIRVFLADVSFKFDRFYVLSESHRQHITDSLIKRLSQLYRRENHPDYEDGNQYISYSSKLSLVLQASVSIPCRSTFNPTHRCKGPAVITCRVSYTHQADRLDVLSVL